MPKLASAGVASGTASSEAADVIVCSHAQPSKQGGRTSVFGFFRRASDLGSEPAKVGSQSGRTPTPIVEEQQAASTAGMPAVPSQPAVSRTQALQRIGGWLTSTATTAGEHADVARGVSAVAPSAIVLRCWSCLSTVMMVSEHAAMEAMQARDWVWPPLEVPLPSSASLGPRSIRYAVRSCQPVELVRLHAALLSTSICLKERGATAALTDWTRIHRTTTRPSCVWSGRLASCGARHEWQPCGGGWRSNCLS
jgi:hypothetical protein